LTVPLGTETFTDLDYADDVALIAEMLEVLLLALDVLKDEAHLLGLEVNWQKIKPRLHDEAGSTSWLDERTTCARRALVEQLRECLQYYTIQMTR